MSFVSAANAKNASRLLEMVKLLQRVLQRKKEGSPVRPVLVLERFSVVPQFEEVIDLRHKKLPLLEQIVFKTLDEKRLDRPLGCIILRASSREFAGRPY